MSVLPNTLPHPTQCSLLTRLPPAPRGCSNHVDATVQYSTVQYSTVQYEAGSPRLPGAVLIMWMLQYSTVQCSTVQYSSVQFSTVQLQYRGVYQEEYTPTEVQYSTVLRQSVSHTPGVQIP